MNKTVGLLFRSKKRNRHSVENVFQNIEPYLSETFNVEKYYLPEDKYFSIPKMIKNIKYTLMVKTDIVHVTGENYFCAMITPREKTVLTILDYVAFNNYKGLFKLLDWLLMYYIPIRKATFITCISQKTYEDTIKHFPWCKSKTYMIPVSISDDFCYEAHEFNKDKPTILIIGSTPNKNVSRIIEAVKGLECKLDIVGELNGEQINKMKEYKIDYSNVYGISNEEVRKHYRCCDIVCFPSTYEGFGMPIVEAQAVGRVVVTSNLSPMKDVAGGAAELVNPFSVDEIRNGLQRLITDDSYRERLLSEGRQNSQKYRNESITKEYLQIYKKVLKNGD